MALLRGTGDWRQVQDDLRAGVYGPWPEVRARVVEELSERAPGHGISSSDVNHTVYAMVRSGELVPQQEALCEGHPAGPFDRMGETVFCDGSCR